MPFFNSHKDEVLDGFDFDQLNYATSAIPGISPMISNWR